MYWNYVKVVIIIAVFEAIACTAAIVIGNEYWPWILLACTILFLLFFVILAFAYVRILEGDWENNLDSTFVNMELVDIPVADGFSIVARVLKKRDLDDKPCSLVIVHHGLSGFGRKLLWLAVPLAMRGYIVLLPDARAHGDSKKRNRKARMDDWYITETTGIIPDFHRIVDYGCSRPDVDTSRIAAIGHSLGGATVLTAGLLDARVKLVIPMSPFYSFVDLMEAKRGRKPLSEEWFTKNFLNLVIKPGKLKKLDVHISPKYYFEKISHDDAREKVRLIHAKDDKLVLFEASAEKIIADLQLPDNNLFLTEKGDHPLRCQETTILAKIFEWLTEEGF
jgi:dipeptidyl aminopeptidase/acylaminoacyl peptidase